MNNLEEIQSKILNDDDFDFYAVIIENDILIIEDEYEMSEDEKNSDDCCDVARENGEMIVRKFPELEVFNYYCHRSKYAIVELKSTIHTTSDMLQLCYNYIQKNQGSDERTSLLNELEKMGCI